jgi:hypothetical protein
VCNRKTIPSAPNAKRMPLAGKADRKREGYGMNTKQVEAVRELCNEFYEELQDMFDAMDPETYEESECVQAAVLAQGMAKDACEEER